MTVTLYSQPGCGPCMATKRALEKRGIVPMVVNIREDVEAADRLKTLGYTGTPVVEVTTESGSYHWGGFQLDKINHLTETQTRH